MAQFDRSPGPRRSGRLPAVMAAILALGLAAGAAPGEAGRIAGRAVRDAGGDAAGGAEVVLLPPPPKGRDVYIGKLPLRRAVADAAGAFAFDGLAPGRYRIWANLGKLTSRRERAGGQVVNLPETGAAVEPVELRLVAGVAVTARVKARDTGRPIPGATVHLGWSDFPDDAATDNDGRTLLQPLTPERWLVEAWADGFAKVSRWINLETGTDAEAEFLLEPGGDLAGVVRDPAGRPLADVGLSAFAEGNYQQLEYVTTDAAGRFRLAHLPRDVSLNLTMTREGYLRKDVSTRVTATQQGLDLVLAPRPHGGTVAGVVLDHEGRPIAGAELINTGRSTDETRATKTGPDGRFRLEDLYESSTGKEVLVRARGSIPKRVKVEPGPPGRPAEVTIRLDQGHRIQGRVTDEGGRPLAGVRVYFARGNYAFSDGGEMTTDERGRFAFDQLPPDCPFTFIKEGYSEIEGRRLPLDTDAEVAVVMAPAGVILGQARDARTGRAVRAFTVRITFSPRRQPGDPSAGLASSLSDPGQDYQSDEGRFRLGDLVVGMPLQVTVAAEGYERRVAERVVAARPDAAQAEDFRLDPLDPAALRDYRGRLLAAEGEPVAGAQLRLIAARGRDPEARGAFPLNWPMIRTGQIALRPNVVRFLQAVTDAEGRFAFAGIPRDAEVELAWWGPGIAPGRADHLERLAEGKNEAIELSLPAPARIIGTVDRTRFADVGRVWVNRADGTMDNLDTDLKPGQTDFAIGDLAPGAYTVSLMGPYERLPGDSGGYTSRSLASVAVTVGPGETGRVSFPK